MNHVVIQIPKNIVVPESEYVLNELRKALNTDKVIVLDLGKNFFYNSHVISLVLLNRERVAIIGGNDKFKAVAKILKIEGLVCILDTIEEFLSKCSQLGFKQCEMCRNKKN
jgi:hypothetical protein